MAYNADNEVREELAKVQKNNRGEFIIATKITNKTSGNVSVDVRQYYTDDNDEVKPTSKGVRFNAENLYDVILGLAKALEANEMIDLADELEVLSGDDTSDTLED